jgi:hypothetical protein
MSDPKYQDIGDRYTRLEEECAEIIQMCCKIKRFGEYNYNPNDPKKKANITLLHSEIKDMLRILRDNFEELICWPILQMTEGPDINENSVNYERDKEKGKYTVEVEIPEPYKNSCNYVCPFCVTLELGGYYCKRDWQINNCPGPKCPRYKGEGE